MTDLSPVIQFFQEELDWQLAEFLKCISVKDYPNRLRQIGHTGRPFDSDFYLDDKLILQTQMRIVQHGIMFHFIRKDGDDTLFVNVEFSKS